MTAARDQMTDADRIADLERQVAFLHEEWKNGRFNSAYDVRREGLGFAIQIAAGWPAENHSPAAIFALALEVERFVSGAWSPESKDGGSSP